MLLTNTVYPLHATKRFRLKGKTTPDFILKAIQAWSVQAQVDARPPPRGECSIGTWSFAWVFSNSGAGSGGKD